MEVSEAQQETCGGRVSRKLDRVSRIPISGLTSLADPPNDSDGGLTRTFEVFHEYPLKFEGYPLSCAKMPGAKESDPD